MTSTLLDLSPISLITILILPKLSIILDPNIPKPLIYISPFDPNFVLSLPNNPKSFPYSLGSKLPTTSLSSAHLPLHLGRGPLLPSPSFPAQPVPLLAQCRPQLPPPPWPADAPLPRMAQLAQQAAPPRGLRARAAWDPPGRPISHLSSFLPAFFLLADRRRPCRAAELPASSHRKLREAAREPCRPTESPHPSPRRQLPLFSPPSLLSPVLSSAGHGTARSSAGAPRERRNRH